MACIVSVQVVYFNLQHHSRHTKLPRRKSLPRRCGRRPRPRPGGQRARPHCRRQQRPISSWPWRRAAGGGIGGRLLRHGRPRGQLAQPRRRSSSDRLQVGGGAGCCGGGCLRPSLPEAPAAAMSRALAGVAVVDVFFAAAVPAGGACRGHVCVGIAGAQNSTAGMLPKAYQIMRNAAKWKTNRYLCSAMLIGEPR